jgi:hypothetical protein
VVLLDGGIHAGEVDGKDAEVELLRGLLDGSLLPQALSKLTIVFVPVFNVDGHERFGPNNRPNQRGPEEMGFRVTAQNLNLNRDYLKAEAPEMQAMLSLLHRYDPVLYADLHVTDGAKFQHDVSVLLEPYHAGQPELRALGAAVHDSIFPALTAQGHLPLDFYPSFVKEDDPSSGFEVGIPPPRFSHAYWSMQNRFAVLVETHSWKDYRARVQATFDVCLALLKEAAEHGKQWREAFVKADAQAAKAERYVLGWEAGKATVPITFKGYAYTREASSVSGQTWVRYDEKAPQDWTVPLATTLVEGMAVDAPKAGWLVLPAYAALVEGKLKLHGLRSTRVKTGVAAAAVQEFRADAVEFEKAPREGRQVAKVKGAWKAVSRAVPAGALFVPAAQPHAVLAAHLFEPAAPDAFAAWGYFNACFEQKEYLEDYVTEEFAREQLKDPAVKAAFEAKLKADPAFAKDPAARLKFFAVRHPSFDERLNVLPVYRLDVPLP